MGRIWKREDFEMKDAKDAREGDWDFDGACAPPETGSRGKWSGQETFSLGCFQWKRCALGQGLKKGKTTYRIKGRCDNPAPAYESARAFCSKKNAEAKEL